MKARQWLKSARESLAGTGAPDAGLDVRYILAHVLGISPARLVTAYDDEITPAQSRKLDEQLASRLEGRPIQYVQGKAFFMGYEFAVDERVLIPRQDTETLCELAIERVKGGCKTVLDICAGSGAVAISIALKCPAARVFASDISPDAIAVARENARRLGARVEFATGDFLSAFEGSFDLITCNPPYLSGEDMKNLQKEVLYEPVMALYGGIDGLDFYKRAFSEIPARLSANGTALFEIGAGQARAVRAMNENISFYKDLNGIDRVIEFGG